jgi:MarR family transcriptional regulator, organic hydroperoxide resistance regulator
MSAKQPRLFHLMSLAQHRLLKTADAAFDDALDISMTQLGVLFALKAKPGASPKTVSETLGINKSATTMLVNRMEAAGLVRRKPSDDDQRSIQLFATQTGLAKAAAARPILTRLNKRLTQSFTEAEIALVARFLEAILERF